MAPIKRDLKKNKHTREQEEQAEHADNNKKKCKNKDGKN